MAMICECGGIFSIIWVEQFPDDLPPQNRMEYNRLCDVECLECGKVLYSQPYDFGRTINSVKVIKEK